MMAFCLAGAAQSGTATSTILSLSSGGHAAASIAAGAPVTLTAAVTAGGSAIPTGQVNFCEAAATYCSDIHVLGTAQLTSAGVATLTLRPPYGRHDYKAVFVGTTKYAASISTTASLSVSGVSPTMTTLAESGSPGDYTLTATVSTSGTATPAPQGSVSFVDTSDKNLAIGMATLGSVVKAPILVGAGGGQSGNGPGALVIADFNGDGNPDIAVGVNNTSAPLSILLGDGAGNFTLVAKPLPSVTGAPMGVADFNGDGHLDLLVTDPLGESSIVLLGNGDGTFTVAPGSPFLNNYGVDPIVIADFNGDGIPDLAEAGGYYLVVQLGNGDGSFTQVSIGSSSISGADSFGKMVTGDFNGDGVVDLAAVDLFGESIYLYLGNGDGTFRAGVTLPLSSESAGSSVGLTVGEFNGDGKLDLAAPIYGDSGSLAVYLGNGDGSFRTAPGSPVTVESFASIVGVGDFNGDGIADIFVAAQTNGQTLNILLGSGDGTFTQMPTGSAGIPCCSSTAIGDLNGDGLTDIVSSSFYEGTADVLLTQLLHATASASGISVSGATVHTADATYPGDANHSSSTSAPVTLLALAPAPVFSPPGGVYPSAQLVSISEPVAGLNIYYMMDGSTPTSGSLLYEAPILVGSQETIKAVGYYSLYEDSPVATASYIISASALPPTFTPGAGTYGVGQQVSLSDAISGADIYFTTDGSTPTTNSTRYTGPITLPASETIQAIAITNGFTVSPVATAAYVIEGPAISSLSPASTSAGGGAVTLTISGSRFVAGSIAYWAGTALTTQYMSSAELTAAIPASLIASAGAAAITVENGAASGETSNAFQFEVDSGSAAMAPAFASTTASVAAGSTATYGVKMAPGVSSATAICLNLPAGATCTYSSTTKAVTIATSSTTPRGTHQITVVFTETIPAEVSALAVVPMLLLPFLSATRRASRRRIAGMACFGLLLLGGWLAGCGGGNSGGSGPPTSQTSQVTNSGTISLTVQ